MDNTITHIFEEKEFYSYQLNDVINYLNNAIEVLATKSFVINNISSIFII